MRVWRLVLGLAAALAAGEPAWAADPCATPDGDADAKYTKLLAEARRDPADVDFGDMRIAYLYSDAYDPAGLDSWNGRREPIIGQIRDGKFAEAAKALEEVIAAYPLSIDARSLARYAYDKLGDEAPRARHSEFGRLLFRGLIDSGDGMTQMTPFLVLSVGEEYTLMRMLGLHHIGQTTLRLKNRVLDKMEVQHGDDGAGHATGVLYFDVTEAFNFMSCKSGGQTSGQKK